MGLLPRCEEVKGSRGSGDVAWLETETRTARFQARGDAVGGSAPAQEAGSGGSERPEETARSKGG